MSGRWIEVAGLSGGQLYIPGRLAVPGWQGPAVARRQTATASTPPAFSGMRVPANPCVRVPAARAAFPAALAALPGALMIYGASNLARRLLDRTGDQVRDVLLRDLAAIYRSCRDW